jgi:hypothetical protein
MIWNSTAAPNESRSRLPHFSGRSANAANRRIMTVHYKRQPTNG